MTRHDPMAHARRYIDRLLPLLVGASILTTAVRSEASKEYVFQNGRHGYYGMTDTYISSSSPNTSYGSETTLDVDGGGPFQGTKQALIRFDGTFGGRESIPRDANIHSAGLRMHTSDDYYAAGDNVYLHRMRVPWSVHSTWNSMVNGVSIGSEADATSDAALLPRERHEWCSTSIPAETLEAWKNDGNNYGWLLDQVGTDGTFLYSGNDSLYPPELTVVTRTAPRLGIQRDSFYESTDGSFYLGVTEYDDDSVQLYLNDEPIAVSGRFNRHIRYTRRFDDDGNYALTFRAVDTDGLEYVQTIDLLVRNLPPRIHGMYLPLEVQLGEMIWFTVSATDPGVEDELTCYWDLDGDGEFDDFVGTEDQFQPSRPGWYHIGVLVVDDDGGWASDFGAVHVVPEPASLALFALGLISLLTFRAA